MMHGIEPLPYKGGHLCAIFKGKGDIDEAAGYRGLLLTNTLPRSRTLGPGLDCSQLCAPGKPWDNWVDCLLNKR